MIESDLEIVERMRLMSPQLRGVWQQLTAIMPAEDVDRLLSLARRGAETQWRPAKAALNSEEPTLWLLRNKQIVLGPANWSPLLRQEMVNYYRLTGDWPMDPKLLPTHFIPLTSLREPSDDRD